MLSNERIEELKDSLLNHLVQADRMRFRDIQNNGASPQVKQELRKTARQYLVTEEKITDKDDLNSVIRAFELSVFGYGVLQDLLDDDSISDIKIVAPDCVRIKRYGIRETSDVKFKDAKAVDRYAEYVATKNHISLSDINAIQTFTDAEGNSHAILRITIMTKFVNSCKHAYMHIRKILKNKQTFDDLIAAGMVSKKTAEYLIYQAQNSSGMIFCGKGASGKTTLMNTLLDYIPHDKSGLVIQENEELFSDTHPDLMFQHIVTNRGEGKIQYELQDLAKNGLLIDLDYFIIGEIKGAEALYMLNASYTGHRCWTSVHAHSSTEAIDKLADYVKYASDYSKEDILKMLRTMSTIVFLDGYKVKEISSIVGFDPDKHELVYKTIKF